jgi:hypothetical protein
MRVTPTIRHVRVFIESSSILILVNKGRRRDMVARRCLVARPSGHGG